MWYRLSPEETLSPRSHSACDYSTIIPVQAMDCNSIQCPPDIPLGYTQRRRQCETAEEDRGYMPESKHAVFFA